MKKLLLCLAALLLFVSCGDMAEFENISIAVNFDQSKRDNSMSVYTPKAYSIGIKKATLIGSGGTEDFILFENADITESENFSFSSLENKTQSLLVQENKIPSGKYDSIEFEVYYLQMTLDVYIDDEAPVDRNLRIYFSDDAELVGGLHQPGDVTSIDSDGNETGWLMGNAYGDFTGMTPRTAAYQNEGVWSDFAGKDGANFGPFGDLEFWEAAEHPIYKEKISFDFDISKAKTVLVEFDVTGTWNCDDVNADGHFNPDDAVEAWHMELPQITAKIES